MNMMAFTFRSLTVRVGIAIPTLQAEKEESKARMSNMIMIQTQVSVVLKPR